MQIRCEKCGTVYELDSSVLPRGGAPVQCTRCSHVFNAVPPEPTGPRAVEQKPAAREAVGGAGAGQQAGQGGIEKTLQFGAVQVGAEVEEGASSEKTLQFAAVRKPPAAADPASVTHFFPGAGPLAEGDPPRAGQGGNRVVPQGQRAASPGSGPNRAVAGWTGPAGSRPDQATGPGSTGNQAQTGAAQRPGPLTGGSGGAAGVGVSGPSGGASATPGVRVPSSGAAGAGSGSGSVGGASGAGTVPGTSGGGAATPGVRGPSGGGSGAGSVSGSAREASGGGGQGVGSGAERGPVELERSQGQAVAAEGWARLALGALVVLLLLTVVGWLLWRG